jgi:hypothetical protein
MRSKGFSAVEIASATINSVHYQLYPHWELWLPGYIEIASAEPRFRIVANDDESAIDPGSLF